MPSSFLPSVVPFRPASPTAAVAPSRVFRLRPARRPAGHRVFAGVACVVWIALGLAAGAASARAAGKAPDPQETLQPDWIRRQGVYLFAEDYNAGSFQAWAKFTLDDVYAVDQAPPRAAWGRQERIKLVDTPRSARPGDRAVQFTVPRALNSFRAELALTQEPGYQERWYGVRIFVPADWVFDEEDGGDIVTQWHHILGGATAPERGNYPPLSIAIKGDRWNINNNYGIVGQAKRDNFYAPAKVIPGQWVSWVIHAQWSPRSEGRLEIWLNGDQVVNKSGPNTYDTPKPHTPYWKIGLYHPEWKTRNASKFNAHPAKIRQRVIVIDDTRMGDERATFRDVAPPQP